MEITPLKPWHHLPAAEVAALLESDPERGLEQEEVERRQERFGLNQLTPKKGRGPLLRLLLQFHQPLIYLLLVSSAITAALREWVDASVILGVVLVNAGIGFIQESKAESAIAALAKIVATHARVLRGGKKISMASEQLVPGDVVLLAEGDKIPADLRLLHCRELRVNESSLTGESLPVTKHATPLAQDTLLADRANMAYAGSLVTSGHALGMVVATSNATETGRISRLIEEADVFSTPLTRKIEWFSKILLYTILALAAFTFVIGLARGESAFDMFMAAVALSVGAIPEGLPAAVTITLAIGVSRMARRRAIIRKLPAVETLGSTTVICSDKTGTLTQNQMMVQHIFAGNQAFTAGGVGYAPHGEITPAPSPAALECLLAGLLCNEASLEHKGGVWHVSGDPTEGALIVSAMKAGLEPESGHAAHPRLDTVPFESRHQYMATLHADCIYLKGAVEKVLERCTAMLGPDGSAMPLDHDGITLASTLMAEQGLRILALASKPPARGQSELNHGDLAADMLFLGLQGMMDLP
ncbi:MAG: HAD-IC family P-type ATPase, partial [Sulfurimicrobium sp.]|nr:HAD-IC family P-type ATPase [Sulfurimicrobium sp.]